MRYFVLTDEEVAKLERVKTRLYSEIRMNGDEMRDNAHIIGYVLDQLIDMTDELDN